MGRASREIVQTKKVGKKEGKKDLGRGEGGKRGNDVFEREPRTTESFLAQESGYARFEGEGEKEVVYIDALTQGRFDAATQGGKGDRLRGARPKG